MVVRPSDAVKEINRALSIIRGQLDEEARRVTPETGPAASAATKADPVLRSFYRASRQLSKLKACLLLQAEIPLEYYWEQERDVEVTEEGRKARSSIMRAQQMAHETYQISMACLNSTSITNTAHHGKAMELWESCHNATAAASSALSAVVNALADFPVPGGKGGVGGAGGVDGDSGRSLRERRHTILSTRAQSGGQSERHVLSTTDSCDYGDNAPARGSLQRCSSSRACRPQRAANALRSGGLLSIDRRGRTGSSLPRSAFSASVADVTRAPPMTRPSNLREMTPPLSLSPLERDGKVCQHSAAMVYEERRVKSRAIGARPRDGLEYTGGSGKNGKLSPEELRAASPRNRRARHGGGGSSSLARWSNGIGKDEVEAGDMDLSVLPVERGQAGNHASQRARMLPVHRRGISRGEDCPYFSGMSELSVPDSYHGGPDSAAGGVRPAPTDRQQLRRMSSARATRDLRGDELERSAISDAAFRILLSTAATPSPRETPHVLRRSLMEDRSAPSDGTDRESTEPEVIPRLLMRPVSIREARESNYEHDGTSASASTAIISADVKDDEATAQRIAQQEMEAQAREDAMLARRLTALEEAGQERERRRARRRNRRHAQLAMLDPATAAAVASEGDVSEAVRVLQFQEIDENDFEVLLELDDNGNGRGGGFCGKGRGLSRQAIGAALESERVSGARLSESCVICMSDFEPGDEVSVLPCKHAFHSGCIRKWLSMRNLCPADMQPVVPEDQGS